MRNEQRFQRPSNTELVLVRAIWIEKSYYRSKKRQSNCMWYWMTSTKSRKTKWIESECDDILITSEQREEQALLYPPRDNDFPPEHTPHACHILDQFLPESPPFLLLSRIRSEVKTQAPRILLTSLLNTECIAADAVVRLWWWFVFHCRWIDV